MVQAQEFGTGAAATVQTCSVLAAAAGAVTTGAVHTCVVRAGTVILGAAWQTADLREEDPPREQ